MKRIITILLSVVLLCCITACNSSEDNHVATSDTIEINTNESVDKEQIENQTEEENFQEAEQVIPQVIGEMYTISSVNVREAPTMDHDKRMNE